MLYWAAVFLVVSIVAAIFGFGLIPSASAGVAQTVFFIFISLFVLTLILRAFRK
ncbi:MAG: DUF1328 domain-containing protein [Roseovarius sp.]